MTRKEFKLIQNTGRSIYRNKQIGHFVLPGLSPPFLDKDIHLFIYPDRKLVEMCEGNIEYNHAVNAIFYTSRYIHVFFMS